jgi:hypothetical protein
MSIDLQKNQLPKQRRLWESSVWSTKDDTFFFEEDLKKTATVFDPI